MATAAPTKRERALALALLSTVLGLAYALLIHPFWTAPMLAANHRVQDLKEREQRIQAQLRQGPQIEQELRTTSDRLTTRPGFMNEPSAELASAALVKRLEEAVRAADPDGLSCAVNNRSPLPQQAEAGRFLRISVRAHLRCGVPQLAMVLHALEGGRPRLFIQNVNLLAHRAGGPRQGSGGLEASFDVSGYIDPGRGTQTPAEGGHAP